MITKLKIDLTSTYIDEQGDFWFYIPEEEKHTFRCAYMMDEQITTLSHVLEFVSNELALDDDSDGCKFIKMDDL